MQDHTDAALDGGSRSTHGSRISVKAADFDAASWQAGQNGRALALQWIDRAIQNLTLCVAVMRWFSRGIKVLVPVRLRIAVVALSISMGLPAMVSADGPPRGERPPEKGWSLTLGGGGLLSPDYEGSDDFEFRALPYISAKYDDWLSFSVPEGLKLTAINEGGFRAGILAGYRFDRDEDDNDALDGWGDIDGTAELGAFAEYKIDSVKFAVDVRQGLSDETGLMATLSARHESRIGPSRISIGPQVTWADDEYMQTYFGITATQAGASTTGYSAYAAAGGVKSFGLGLSVFTPVTDSWAITAIASVNQLSGDAADSPIVTDEGSETQYMVGIFAGYRF